MAALDFPPSPIAGDKYPVPAVVGQPQYTFDGTKWTTVGAQVTTAAPASALPLMDQLTALVGTTTKYAREDHVHPINTSLLVKKSYILNGAMMVSQENGATAGAAVGYYPVDGFAYIAGGTTGVVSGQQVASATPGGSPKRARWAIATSDAALAADDVAFIRATVEGLRAADLRSGTAGAKTVTLRFGINAFAGTYCVAIRNAAGNRSYVVPVTVPAGESIQSVTIPLDTAGTWASDNTLALEISWCLMSGLTYQTASPNTWTATAAIATSAQTNWLANAPGSIFELFDVSLTEGPVAPPFVVPDYASELALCQRYFCNGYVSWRGTIVAGATYTSMMVYFPCFMRAIPAMTVAIDSVTNLGSPAGTINPYNSGVEVYHPVVTTGLASFFDVWKASARL